MPKEVYVKKRFTIGRQIVIDQANEIIEEYMAAGYALTLRQLYYQFVARNYFENKHSNYKRLSETLRDARLAGAVDWLALVDRTRSLTGIPYHDNPAHALQNTFDNYAEDVWK